MMIIFRLWIPSLFVLFFSCQVWGAVLNESRNYRPEVGAVLNIEGKPLPEVVIIFQKFKPDLMAQPTLSYLNKIGQEEFLRPLNAERFSKEAIEHYKKICSCLSIQDRDNIINSFKKIGNIDAIYPLHKNPDYVLIQGSTLSNLRERLMFFASLVTEKRVMLSSETRIVFLMGDRNLFDVETPEVLLNPTPFKLREGWLPPKALPMNEMDLGEFTWEQLDIPSELRDLKPLFIKAQKKPAAARAQTEDCVKEFVETQVVPEGSSFLIISENPYIYYQKRVTKLMFKKLGYEHKNLQFEAVGKGMKINSDNQVIIIGLLMDTLARTLYTETKLQN
ncbi:MAG: hypothetical protein K2P93_00995 [Alphaproteobacteria bacterium]|nr:hypothetical protein [Alphaproteobacteria bacterium]